MPYSLNANITAYGWVSECNDGSTQMERIDTDSVGRSDRRLRHVG